VGLLEVQDHMIFMKYGWSLAEWDALPVPRRRKYFSMLTTDADEQAKAMEDAKAGR